MMIITMKMMIIIIIIIIITIIDGDKGRTPRKSVHVNSCLHISIEASYLVMDRFSSTNFGQQKRPPCRPSERRLIESLFPLKSLFH